MGIFHTGYAETQMFGLHYIDNTKIDKQLNF